MFFSKVWSLFVKLLFVQTVCLRNKTEHQSSQWELIGLTPPYVCARPNPGHGFLKSYFVVFFMFNYLRSEVIIRLGDISRINNH